MEAFLRTSDLRPAGPTRASRAGRSWAAVLLVAVGLSLAACDSAASVPGGGSDPEQPAPEAPSEPETTPPPPGVDLALVAEGFQQPLGVVTDGTSSDLYVMEQGGTVRVVQAGEVVPGAFLDLAAGGDFTSGGEQGLLGMLFHPQYPGEVFVHYTGGNGDTVLSRMPVEGGQADRSNESQVLRFGQPGDAHNGGQLAAGPDGMLYMALGDGGAEGGPDAEGHGQDPMSWYGTILRIDPADDPSAADAYSVPEDNPFADGIEGRPEVWQYGLRNPWRFSFDAATGDLWIADVGEHAMEEVDFVPADADVVGGHNFGWSVMEGDECLPGTSSCDPSGLTPPLLTYGHDEGFGQSITGGYVYRGDAIPELEGTYVFSDWIGGAILAAVPDETGGWRPTPLLEDTGLMVSSFGVDADGELLVVHYGTFQEDGTMTPGSLHRIVAQEE